MDLSDFHNTVALRAGCVRGATRNLIQQIPTSISEEMSSEPKLAQTQSNCNAIANCYAIVMLKDFFFYLNRESNSNVIISVLSHKGGNIRPHKYFYLFESEGATVIFVNDE